MSIISTNTYVSNFDADGQAAGVKLMTNERGHLYPISKLFTGNTLNDAMKVVAPSQAIVGVEITAGYVQIPATAEDYSYLGWLDEDSQLTFDNAVDVSNPRYTAIVAYIKRDIQYDESQFNNPGLLQITNVLGLAAANPVQVDDARIKQSIVENNPYIILAQVYIPANATSISSSNIVDKRVPISLARGVSLPQGSYASGVTAGTGSSYSNNLQISVINANASVPTSTDSDLLVLRINQ